MRSNAIQAVTSAALGYAFVGLAGSSAAGALLPGLEKDRCGLPAVPTNEEEDARRLHQERRKQVGERAKLINAPKSIFDKHGIRGFRAHLKTVPKRLEGLLALECRPNDLLGFWITVPAFTLWLSRIS